jgi:hypothetical protein
LAGRCHEEQGGSDEEPPSWTDRVGHHASSARGRSRAACLCELRRCRRAGSNDSRATRGARLRRGGRCLGRG